MSDDAGFSARGPEGRGEEDSEDFSPDRVVYLIEETKVGNSFQAVCPELLITAFGDTEEEARNGLRQQVADYLEDCDNLGVLDETLIEAGFYLDLDPDTRDGVWMSNEVKPPDGPEITIL